MEIINKIKRLFSKPREFFRKLKSEKDVTDALIFFTILGFINTVLAFIVSLFTQKYTYDLMSKIFGIPFTEPTYSIGFLITITLLGFILTVATTFIGAGIIHLWILVFNGKEKYTKTYQLCIYSMTPKLLFSWIPIVSLFAWIYDIYLLIVGTEEIHKISNKTAIWMYIIPIIIIAIIFILLITLFILLIKSHPEFLTPNNV